MSRPASTFLRLNASTYLASRRIHGLQIVSLQVYAVLRLPELLHSIPGSFPMRRRRRDGPKDVADDIPYRLPGRHFIRTDMGFRDLLIFSAHYVRLGVGLALVYQS